MLSRAVSRQIILRLCKRRGCCNWTDIGDTAQLRGNYPIRSFLTAALRALMDTVPDLLLHAVVIHLYFDVWAETAAGQEATKQSFQKDYSGRRITPAHDGDIIFILERPPPVPTIIPPP